MQDNMKMIYEAPEIEIVKVEVEEGFSASLGYSDDYADDQFDVI